MFSAFLALISVSAEAGVQGNTAVACHRALAHAGGFDRFTGGYLSFPGYLGQESGVYLVMIGSRTAEFFPRIIADKHLYFLEFASLSKGDVGVMVSILRRRGSIQVPLDGRVTGHLSRTLRAQVRQLFDDLTTKPGRLRPAAALELGNKPMQLSDRETEALMLLHISVEFELIHAEELRPNVNAGSAATVDEIYQKYLAAKKDKRTFIPTPNEFILVAGQLDRSIEASEMFDEATGLLRQLMVQSEANRPPVTWGSLDQALQVCEEVRGDLALGQLAKDYRQALKTLPQS